MQTDPSQGGGAGLGKSRPNKEEEERLRRKLLEQQRLKARAKAAGRIQAWWRGTLVRRTLLVAALRAWMIQVWWRALQWRRVQKLRQALLKAYVIQERAAVRLQSWVRTCQCRERYCQVCNALCLLQAPRHCLPLLAEDRPRVEPAAAAAKRLEFHVEILSI
ncbi:IQ domain-containing protein F3 [Pteronotus mesoamericanus]|uniref:IQ domain-containing protein F3 n=1 Tax=Pteronotus mesoamericanus TaxID=1884717 RepID=UPI0023ECEEFB|nr:IQ domain-containing protein F3 [Pteronotus parnellii mesoamericanus]